MSARSRAYGHGFERLIARAYRAKWPDATVRRALQAHSAYEPDVVVEGLSLWTECSCGSSVSPLKKLAQAERDVERCMERAPGTVLYPVVVWRNKGERTVWVTMRLWVLDGSVLGERWPYSPESNLVVTLDFERWLECVALAPPEKCNGPHLSRPEEAAR